MTTHQSRLQLSQPASTSISVTRKLSASKYPVYLAPSSTSNKPMALKSFPYKHPHYLKEKNILMTLHHPHIIALHEAVDNATIIRGQTRSYIGLEYALHGDLLDVINLYGRIPETLARTLFHHLIDAISYMHENNVVHMDLKVDNLLVDEQFNLKIIDFDLSEFGHSTNVDTQGTPGCRAPELKKGTCTNLRAADVYSAGVVLFSMLSGNPPYNEISKGYQLEFDSLYKVMRSHNKKFWEVHSRHRGNANFYSEGFKKLFGRMMEEDPEKRATIEDVKESEWFKGTVYDKEEYKVEMKKYMKQDEEML